MAANNEFPGIFTSDASTSVGRAMKSQRPCMPTVENFGSCVSALLRRHSFKHCLWEDATKCPVQGRHLQHECLWLYTVQVCMHIMYPSRSTLCTNCITASHASRPDITACRCHHGAVAAMCIMIVKKSRPCIQKMHTRSLALKQVAPVLAPSFSTEDASTLITVPCRHSPGSAELHPQAIINPVLKGLLAFLTMRAGA